MPKKFWIDCLRIFLRFTIPTLGTLLSFICLFSNDFERNLKNFGIIGLILLLCLLFAITLILELTGIFKLYDNIKKGVITKDDLVDNSLYGYFRTYKKEVIRQKRGNKNPIKKEIENKNNFRLLNIDDEYFKDFHYYSFKQDLNDYIETNNEKIIKNYFSKWEVKLIDIDVIQESFYIFFSYGIMDLFDIFLEKLKVSLPELLLYDYLSNGTKEFSEKIKQNNICTIINKFEGKFEGTFTGYYIIGFDQDSILQMKTILEERYAEYITNYNKMLLSFMKEVGSMVTLSGLTSISELIFTSILNKKDKPIFKIVDEISNTKLENLSLGSNFVVVRVVVKMLNSNCSVYLYLVMELHFAKKIPLAFVNELYKSNKDLKMLL